MDPETIPDQVRDMVQGDGLFDPSLAPNQVWGDVSWFKVIFAP